MKKQSREIVKSIEKLIKEGHTKDAIFIILTKQYEDKNLIAKSLCRFADKDTREKNKLLNSILIALLVILGIINFLSMFGTIPDLPISLLLIMAFFMPAIFIIEVSKYNGLSYNVLFFWTLAAGFKSLENNLREVQFSSTPFYMTISLFIFIFSIPILAFFLRKRMFPNIGLWGPRKNENGEIMYN